MPGQTHDREPLAAVPLDYEPPRRPAPRLWLIVALCLGLALVLLAGATLFGVRQTAPAPVITITGNTSKPTLLAPSQGQMAGESLPAEGVELTLKQRERRWLPGGEMELALDDITAGQVLLSISDTGGTVLLGPVSVREGDAIAFSALDGQRLQLQVQQLVNHLTGDDFATLRLSAATADEPATQPN